MVAEVFTLVFAIIGILSILRYFIFKLMCFKENHFLLVLPIFTENEEIFSKIENTRELLEFLGIHKKSTIVIVNYGAAEWFIKKIEEMYGYYEFLEIINSEELSKTLTKADF